MSDQQRQKKLLALLLVALLGFSTYRAIQLTGEKRSAGGRSGGANPVERTLAALEVPHLNLELLRREAATYKPGRDPFRFGVAPKPAPVVRKERPRPKPKPRPAPTPVAREQPQPPRPQPPQVSFTYLGSFGPSDRRIAVFAKGDEIFNALTGDVLLEDFIVGKIGFESADIGFVDFPDVPGTRLEAGAREGR